MGTRRPNRWETYYDGRRPDKARLIDEILPYLVGQESDAADSTLWCAGDLRRDLAKLRIESLAVLLDVLMALEEAAR